MSLIDVALILLGRTAYGHTPEEETTTLRLCALLCLLCGLAIGVAL